MKDYLYISEALKCCRGDRNSNRSFGLARGEICSNPFVALKEWAFSRLSIHNLIQSVDERLLFLRRIWFVLIMTAVIFGAVASVSLLTYNGSEPVNIFYFLIFSIVLPLFGLILTVVSITEIKLSNETIAVDFMPPYWIVSLFKKDKSNYKIPSLLLKTYIIYMAQIISILFYISMFLALFAVIAGKDVAFGWSSTLPLTPEQLHTIFYNVAFVWRDILPSAVPSVSLIEHSHYFRLGSWHPQNIIELGEWWRFLAMTIVVYAILPRLILSFWTYRLYKRAERDTVLSLDGASDVIDEICNPIVESRADNEENILHYEIDNSLCKSGISKEYSTVAGWSISRDEIETVLTHKDIVSQNIVEFGGANDIDDDFKTIDSIKKGKILLIVKSWEPPTMDLMDIIEKLSQKGMIVDIAPIGFEDEDFECNESDYKIWRGKIDYLNIEHVKVVKI